MQDEKFEIIHGNPLGHHGIKEAEESVWRKVKADPTIEKEAQFAGAVSVPTTRRTNVVYDVYIGYRRRPDELIPKDATVTPEEEPEF